MACDLPGRDEPAAESSFPPATDSSGLAVTLEGGAARLMLRLRGELDLCSAERLRRAVDAALAQSPAVLVMDLSGLGFTDCAGIRVLLETYARQAQAGNRFLLTGVRPPVRRLLQLTGAEARLGGTGQPAPRPRAPT